MKRFSFALLALSLNGCIVLEARLPPPAEDVVLCHKGKKTMTVPSSAAQGHINHGDHYGSC